MSAGFGVYGCRQVDPDLLLRLSIRWNCWRWILCRWRGTCSWVFGSPEIRHERHGRYFETHMPISDNILNVLHYSYLILPIIQWGILSLCYYADCYVPFEVIGRLSGKLTSNFWNLFIVVFNRSDAAPDFIFQNFFKTIPQHLLFKIDLYLPAEATKAIKTTTGQMKVNKRIFDSWCL